MAKTAIRRIGSKSKTPPLDFIDPSLNDKELKDFYKKAIYSKCFNFTTSVGDTVPPIQLGGSARKLWGINVFCALASAAQEDTFSLLINSEQMIQNAIWWAYNPQATSGNVDKARQWFDLPRPLSGSDDVQLTWKAGTAHTVSVIFYLSNMVS